MMQTTHFLGTVWGGVFSCFNMMKAPWPKWGPQRTGIPSLLWKTLTNPYRALILILCNIFGMVLLLLFRWNEEKPGSWKPSRKSSVERTTWWECVSTCSVFCSFCVWMDVVYCCLVTRADLQCSKNVAVEVWRGWFKRSGQRHRRIEGLTHHRFNHTCSMFVSCFSFVLFCTYLCDIKQCVFLSVSKVQILFLVDFFEAER